MGGYFASKIAKNALTIAHIFIVLQMTTLFVKAKTTLTCLVFLVLDDICTALSSQSEYGYI